MPDNSPAKIAIVTGSSKGIGKAIAEELAARGTTVVVTSRDAEQAQQVADAISSTGASALGLPFNLDDRESLRPLIENTLESFGRLDLLVNNALSQSAVLPLDTLSDAQVALAFEANITHNFLLTRLAHPHLKQSRGNVINIGSVAVNRHVLGLPMYAIIKGAISQMTKALAAEWAADGIRVNGINPGFVYTSALPDLGLPADVVEKHYDLFKQYTALHRIGRPEEIGKIAAYIASEDAGLMTGSIIDIDGGYSVKGLPMYQGE